MRCLLLPLLGDRDVKRQFREMMGVDGYTTFDVAPFYGHVERWLGEVRPLRAGLHHDQPYMRTLYAAFVERIVSTVRLSFSIRWLSFCEWMNAVAVGCRFVRRSRTSISVTPSASTPSTRPHCSSTG